MFNVAQKAFSIITLIALTAFLVISLTGCGSIMKLFGGQENCEHSYTEAVVPPTCTEGGYTEHICSLCEHSYRDTETTALGHSYSQSIIAPTCLAEGFTEHMCSVCGDKYTDTVTARIGHRFNGAVCSGCGIEEITEPITPLVEWFDENTASFILTTADELAGLAALVNDGISFGGKTVRLGADIDLGYAEWIPIGNSEHPFNGSFYGQGHKILGMKINAKSSYVGLFGNLSGIAEDFSVMNATVWTNNDYEYIGLVAGYVTGTLSKVKSEGFIDTAVAKYVGGIGGYNAVSSAVFKDLESSATVNGGDYTGGIYGSIKSNGVVFADGMISTGNINGGGYTGGIFGYIEGKDGSNIKSAKVSGSVSGSYYVGGIAGKAVKTSITSCSNEGAEISADDCLIEADKFFVYLGGYVGYGYSISGCVNRSHINYTSRGRYTGGIAGYLTSVVSNCENHGNISAYDTVGGIAGYIETAGIATVSGLTNTGSIEAQNGSAAGIIALCNPTATITLSDLNNSGNINGACNSGGIIGGLSNAEIALTASNLANSGSVTTAGNSAGGLFGYIMASASSVIRNSSSSAAISGLHKVGGLIGEAKGLTLKDCSNAGTSVCATGWHVYEELNYAYLGGYIGNANNANILNCINDTDITYEGVGMYVGGIAGVSNGSITGCINNGDISSTMTNVGGISGSSGGAIKNCTNNGAVRSTMGYVGGISGKSGAAITDCKNSGEITGLENYIGGITGYTTAAITDCENTGSIYGEGDYVAGIVGKVSPQQYSLSYSNLVNSGNVTGKQFVAGMIGDLYLSYALFDVGCDRYDVCDNDYSYPSNMKNKGNITGDRYVGGIMGHYQVENTYYKKHQHNAIGWHIDTGKFSASMSNFENLGIVSGNNSIGELIGAFSTDGASTITTYTVTGKITLNGEAKEGTYDVGTNTNLALNGRTVYVPPVEEPPVEEPETDGSKTSGEESTDNANVAGGKTSEAE